MPIRVEYEGTFLMSPKNDFAFKKLFGDERNKHILIAFLKAVLKTPDDELEDIELVNTELKKEYIKDHKAILDVMARTKKGVCIDIEIQVIETKYMFERTLYYWGKMYNQQMKEGDGYDKLKKAITINILDFNFMPTNNYHSALRLIDETTGAVPTDMMLICFLELKKLPPLDKADLDDPLIQWMMFIGADKKEVLDVLIERNSDIANAYEVLKVLSMDDNARALYTAREKAIRDEITRINTAKIEGKIEGKHEIAQSLLLEGMDVAFIVRVTGLPEEEVNEILGKIRMTVV